MAEASRGRWSYSTSTRMRLLGRLAELARLYRHLDREVEPSARRTVESWNRLVARVRAETGVEVRDLEVLEIGPGQQLGRLRCAARDNRVTALDMDPIPQGLDPAAYLRLLRRAPGLRLVKTVARQALGIDRRFRAALARELGVPDFGRLRVLQGDATRMPFPDAAFDLVYSYSAFEHIAHPERALAEVARVLRPGGVAFLSLHLVTSHSGCHDPRVLFEPEPRPPFWPHLRAAYRDAVRPSAWLNDVRLEPWHALFREAMPGVRFLHERQETLREPLARLRAAGELRDHTDEELLTVNVIGVWHKGHPFADEGPSVRWVP